MIIARHPQQITCQYCHYTMDCSTTLFNQVAPRPNDFTFCFNCQALNVYTRELTLRRPTQIELNYIATSREAQEVQTALSRMYKRGRKH